MMETEATANQVHKPKNIGFRPFEMSFFKWVLRPMADMAMTMTNLPIWTSVLVTSTGKSMKALSMAVAIKPMTNQGKTLAK